MIEVISFPARYGESFLIRFKDIKKNILIDGGFKDTYDPHIKKKLEELKNNNESIDLLIITHIDLDHIEGIKHLLEENISDSDSNIIKIKEVWFNSYATIQSFNTSGQQCSKESLDKLKKIITFNSYPKNNNSEIAISDEKSVTQLLTEGKYTINSTPICCENSTNKKIDNINIHVISPTLNEIKLLEKEFKNQLKVKGIPFNDEYHEVISSAIEYLNLRHEEIEYETARLFREISVSNSPMEFFSEENINLILKEEYSKKSSNTNASSIGIMIEYNKTKMLFLGDSSPAVIEKSIDSFLKETDDLFFNLIKISHHGSKSYMSNPLLNKLKTNQYLISTDGSVYSHPDIELITKLIFGNKEQKTIFLSLENKNPNNKKYLNFLINNQELKNIYNYEIIFLNGDSITLNEK